MVAGVREVGLGRLLTGQFDVDGGAIHTDNVTHRQISGNREGPPDVKCTDVKCRLRRTRRV